jgi:hypothetical protein
MNILTQNIVLTLASVLVAGFVGIIQQHQQAYASSIYSSCISEFLIHTPNEKIKQKINCAFRDQYSSGMKKRWLYEASMFPQ